MLLLVYICQENLVVNDFGTVVLRATPFMDDNVETPAVHSVVGNERYLLIRGYTRARKLEGSARLDPIFGRLGSTRSSNFENLKSSARLELWEKAREGSQA